jgi:hypothetical protein
MLYDAIYTTKTPADVDENGEPIYESRDTFEARDILDALDTIREAINPTPNLIVSVTLQAHNADDFSLTAAKDKREQLGEVMTAVRDLNGEDEPGDDEKNEVGEDYEPEFDEMEDFANALGEALDKATPEYRRDDDPVPVEDNLQPWDDIDTHGRQIA